jgi:hypothetical protein
MGWCQIDQEQKDRMAAHDRGEKADAADREKRRQSAKDASDREQVPPSSAMHHVTRAMRK